MVRKMKSIPGNSVIDEHQVVVYATNGGFKGEINLQWDSVGNAKSYVVQIKQNSSNSWKHIDIINEPSYMINNLKSGKKYFFRVAPVFNDKQGAWSEPVFKIVK